MQTTHLTFVAAFRTVFVHKIWIFCTLSTLSPTSTVFFLILATCGKDQVYKCSITASDKEAARKNQTNNNYKENKTKIANENSNYEAHMQYLHFEQLFQQFSSINVLFFLHSPYCAQSGHLIGCLSTHGAGNE